MGVDSFRKRVSGTFFHFSRTIYCILLQPKTIQLHVIFKQVNCWLLIVWKLIVLFHLVQSVQLLDTGWSWSRTSCGIDDVATQREHLPPVKQSFLSSYWYSRWKWRSGKISVKWGFQTVPACNNQIIIALFGGIHVLLFKQYMLGSENVKQKDKKYKKVSLRKAQYYSHVMSM